MTEISCPVCGCVNYTRYGCTPWGKWVFACSLGHKWRMLSTKKPFPWRDDDANSPANLKINTEE